MKFKTSKKFIKDNNYYILSVGYCDLQHLLRYKEPIAYSAGTYGWSCDYYQLDNLVISTGYNPIKNKNIDIDYSIIREYENKAKKIIEDNKINYEDYRKQVDELLNEFIILIKNNKEQK